MASIFILFSQPFNTDVDESPVSAFYNVSSIVSVFATVLIEAIIIFAYIFFSLILIGLLLLLLPIPCNYCCLIYTYKIHL